MIPQLQTATAASSPEIAPRWSIATRIGFRFVFSYFFLYISPGAVGSLGIDEKVAGYRAIFSGFWHQVVPWVGQNLLGLKGSLVEVANGSGDQLYDYVLLVCIFVAAGLTTIVWSVLDRKRSNYRVLHQWLRLAMRLLLLGTMLNYGIAKIFPMQFVPLPLGRLVDPLGHVPPLGLLWIFMGYSRLYTIFGGLAEFAGGLLLIVPGLTTIGALVSLGALSNVLALNLAYDVPRKIVTTHLILICIFLILPDLRRMLNLFILNRATEPVATVPFLKDRLLNRGVYALQYLCCAAIFVMVFQSSYYGAPKVVAHIDASLRGIWFVEKFTTNNIEQPLLVTNNQRWQNVIFDNTQSIMVQPMDGPLQIYLFTLSDGGKALDLVSLDDPNSKARFLLEPQGNDRMLMTGQANGMPISATLRRLDLSDPTKFILWNRGFHWVTGVPRWR
jgi:hypothetical protein